jgi:hypothetical protein
MKELTFLIEGLPASVNRFRQKNTRGRMTTVKAEREKAYMTTLFYVRQCFKSGNDSFDGATDISFEFRTSRAFRDPNQLGAGLKHYIDGICQAVLPLGDGFGTPYRWQQPTQVKVKTRKEEGVLVTIREINLVQRGETRTEPSNGG